MLFDFFKEDRKLGVELANKVKFVEKFVGCGSTPRKPRYRSFVAIAAST